MTPLFRLELRRVLRSAVLVGALLLWIAAALAAIVNGQRVIERQQRAIAHSEALQQEQHRAVLGPQPATATAGDQLYYLAFHTRHHPSPWAALAVGQRDQRAFNLKVRMLALHGQLYDGEITSPLLGAFGTLDFAFVLVVLSPLLVVALFYDLVSAEREGGTWSLVRANPTPLGRVLAVKVLARFGLVAAVVAGVAMAAPPLTGAPVDARVLAHAVVAGLYLLVWTALATLVATFRRGSGVNALLLLGTWIVLVVVGPALVATAAAARFPTPEALELTIAQRQGYHAGWDRPVAETMAGFTARYREWSNAEVPTDRYSNPWYYAMQQRGDDAAAPAARRYRSALEARHAWAQRWWPILPPAVVQTGLARVARTDLPAYLAYLDSVTAFHETLKRRFLPVVFSDATIRDVDWRDVPRHRHADDGAPDDLWAAAIPLALWAAACVTLVWLRRSRLGAL